MKKSKRTTTLIALVLSVAATGLTSLTRAELRVVDGNLWAASTEAEKSAYLIGIANAVAVNRAIRERRGTAEPQSVNDRIEAALDVGTIEDAVDRIDDWYAANPSRTNVPVLGVVWMEMVGDEQAGGIAR